MQDYTSNSNKAKEDAEKKEAKTLDPVVTGSVVARKKSIGQKFVAVFSSENLLNSAEHIWMVFLLPAAKNMLWDFGQDAMRRSGDAMRRNLFGTSANPSRFGTGPSRGATYSYTSYDQVSSPISRGSIPKPLGPGQPDQAAEYDPYVFQFRKDAENVLTEMSNNLERFDVVTVAELKELCKIRPEHVDQSWGWDYIGNFQIRRVREGWLLDFPRPQPIH